MRAKREAEAAKQAAERQGREAAKRLAEAKRKAMKAHSDKIAAEGRTRAINLRYAAEIGRKRNKMIVAVGLGSLVTLMTGYFIYSKLI